MLFTLIAIATVDKWGRKPLMLLGTAGMGVSLVAMGVMAQALADPAAASQWMLLFIILYIACFGLSVGPVTWVILSEIFPTAVRGRALGLATFFLWTADYAVTQTFPMMDAKGSWFVAALQPCLPVLHLRGVLRRAGPGGLAPGPGNQGPLAGGDRAKLERGESKIRNTPLTLSRLPAYCCRQRLQI